MALTPAERAKRAREKRKAERDASRNVTKPVTTPHVTSRHGLETRLEALEAAVAEERAFRKAMEARLQVAPPLPTAYGEMEGA